MQGSSIFGRGWVQEASSKVFSSVAEILRLQKTLRVRTPSLQLLLHSDQFPITHLGTGTTENLVRGTLEHACPRTPVHSPIPPPASQAALVEPWFSHLPFASQRGAGTSQVGAGPILEGLHRASALHQRTRWGGLLSARSPAAQGGGHLQRPSSAITTCASFTQQGTV